MTERNGSTNGATRKRPAKPAESRELPYDQRPVPSDREAERGILGSILKMPEAIDEVQSIIRPEDFLDDGHEKIYRAMLALWESKGKIDATLLGSALIKSKDYEIIGGSGYLLELFNSVPHAMHAKYYAELMREQAILRRVILASS